MFKKWTRIVLRTIAWIIILALSITFIGAVLECPETLTQLLITSAVAIYLMWFAFKTLMPKTVVSGFKKGGKKVRKGIWKFVF
ncbi:hypothetical protein HOB25_02045 [bacterium]|jgi:hypothetical protein|nr:hypothetical protein [bacterium]MBT4251688.1 hypothetical protein [bacterium]MBT4597738.1 hypothetical protein [bacterium]MBT6753750.1 hypothetical protein [bacterium]MBT7992619.1 hypothetical protein [bacterium]